MSQPALKLVGAELEQPETEALTAPGAEVSALAVEAQRLADLAAAFCVFGLRISLPEYEAQSNDSAEQAYLESIEAPAPANDVAPAAAPAFPELTTRGLHLNPTLPVKLMQALDWLIVLAAAQFAALWGAGVGLGGLSLGAAAAYIAAAGALKLGLWLTDSYRFRPARVRAERSLGGLAIGAVVGLVIAAALAPDARGAAALAATLPITATFLAGMHAALAIWIRAAHRRGVFAENVVLIGATDAAERMVRRAAKSGEARIVAIVDDRIGRSPAQVGAAPVVGGVADLLAWEGLPNVDRIVITVTQKAEGRVRDIIERLRLTPNRVDLLLDYQTQSVQGRGVDRLTGAAVACVSGRPREEARAFVKRAQDIIIGGALLIVFALPMLALAAAIKIDSKGPALYRQRRLGFNNRTITVLKFRTMRHEPDAPLAQVRANDPRVTRIGAWLRHTSIDELPQLLNVLKGEMSLVGPRPHAIGMKAADRDLDHIVAEYAHRHRVKPGLTGWAQVNGSRGPVHTAAELRRRVRLDLEYVARPSLWLDLQILLRTAPALFGDTKVTR